MRNPHLECGYVKNVKSFLIQSIQRIIKICLIKKEYNTYLKQIDIWVMVFYCLIIKMKKLYVIGIKIVLDVEIIIHKSLFKNILKILIYIRVIKWSLDHIFR